MFFRQKVSPKESIALYRRCMKIIMRLQPNHQKIWYDYTRLKFEENAQVTDKAKIKKLIADAEEEINWVKSVLDRKP